MWWRRRHRQQRLRRLTLAGRLIMVATLFSCLALVNRGATPWLALLLVAWVVQLAMGFLNRPRVRCRVQLPADTRVGELRSVGVQIFNEASSPLHDARVRLQLPSGEGAMNWEVQLAGLGSKHVNDRNSTTSHAEGIRAEVSHSAAPQQRGHWTEVSVQVETRFPLGWLRWWRHFTIECPYWVAPPPAEWRFEALVRGGDERSEAEWIALSEPILRAGVELSHLREYAPGMDVRRWHHAAWARTQMPTICEFARDTVSPIRMLLVPPVIEAGQDRGEQKDVRDAYELLLSSVADLAAEWEDGGREHEHQLVVWTRGGWRGGLGAVGRGGFSSGRLLAEADVAGRAWREEPNLNHELEMLIDRTLPIVFVRLGPDTDAEALRCYLEEEDYKVIELVFGTQSPTQDVK